MYHFSPESGGQARLLTTDSAHKDTVWLLSRYHWKNRKTHSTKILQSSEDILLKCPCVEELVSRKKKVLEKFKMP